MSPQNNKIDQLANFSLSFGKVGLLVIENNNEFEQKIDEIRPPLSKLEYKLASDYLEIMDALSGGLERVVYIERAEKLDGNVLEIVAEFEAGIVSLADKKNKTGLKTAKWNPSKISLLIIMTRRQVENSYDKLFNYLTIVQSI